MAKRQKEFFTKLADLFEEYNVDISPVESFGYGASYTSGVEFCFESKYENGIEVIEREPSIETILTLDSSDFRKIVKEIV